MIRAAWLRRCVAASSCVPALALTQPRSDAAAKAQSVLRGNVAADPGDSPLAGVEVLVPALERSARSDSAGDFVLAGLPAGRHRVVLRKVGYGSAMFDVTATGSDTLQRDVALVRAAQVLAAVDVKTPVTPARLAEFERRRAAGIGHFLTTDVFDADPERTLASFLVGRVAGINIKQYALTGALLVAGGRGEGSVLGVGATRAEPFDPKSPVACWANVYLNGVKIYATGSQQTVPSVAAYYGRDVAAVEYYAGGATTPPEFGGTSGSCGTLLIWTRR
ncbi:hypothetical protein J421_2357 [Gemmatirosa kalamazoonensis]|uniref:TonB-dependent receptor plug n=1 Tax=Gemmatirosa kalamazoonensis TaxID=861299 RepID=W0RFL6_9BACT|nr:carboxypeptidase regulatory-like domain-containing protein [Gemmatirosa kalamazoonensis]AHG89894.1 hypothetical protein J421_2357 [Gemmatirosa kalamazoonensis]